MSVEVLPAFRPATLDPVPTEMLATLAAPEVKARLVAESVVAPMVKPPIVPVGAERAPAKVAAPVAASMEKVATPAAAPTIPPL